MQKKMVLACLVCGSRNYTTTTGNGKAERMELKKFCKHCNEHTIHRGTK
ncbi:50S ribosomal protein L33 [Heyndrickxia faecalis]